MEAGHSKVAAVTLALPERATILGIVNATDDSFSSDGVAGDVAALQAQGLRMVIDGADALGETGHIVHDRGYCSVSRYWTRSSKSSWVNPRSSPRGIVSGYPGTM